MAKRPAKQAIDWATTFRQQVRLRTAAGWCVYDARGVMRLRVRSGSSSSSVTLPYAWRLEDTADALKRIEYLYAQVCAGQTLEGAAEITDKASSRTTLKWSDALERFRQHKLSFGTAIKERTWQITYERTLTEAVSLLNKRRVHNAEDLLDAVLVRWKPGSRARQIAAQNLSQFLSYATQRLKFPNCWMPPPKLSTHVGQRPHGSRKRDGYPLTDAQILRLIDNLPAGDHVPAWSFGLQLLATYGLRPEELRYLVLRNGQLWCDYQKKGGGGQTLPRPLHPLPVRDIDSTPADWHLEERLAAGEPLPPLGQPGKGGEALLTFLRRVPMWRSIKAEVAASGDVLTPYSFRHRYSREAHRLGIPSKDVAQAMGHSLECHLRAYAKFTSDQTANAFAEATQRADALATAISA